MAKTEEITGVQKAAILLIALGPDKSSNVFKHLKEDEIEQLTLEIANTRSISPAMKDAVLDEFYEVCLAQQYIAEGGIGYAKDLLEKDRCKSVIELYSGRASTDNCFDIIIFVIKSGISYHISSCAGQADGCCKAYSTDGQNITGCY